MKNNTADAFVSRINYTSNCWEWTGYLETKNGYGRYKQDGQWWWAHRYAYQLWNGPLEEGKVIMHSCDNPCCVNPAHLSQGTIADNNRDSAVKLRRPAKLNPDAVRAIRAMHKLGVNQTALGKQFGVSRRAIYEVIHRLSWKHVD